MQKNKELFRKAAELIPFLAKAKYEKYEKIKAEAFKESVDKSKFVKDFIRVLFEIVDEKRKIKE